MSPLRPMPAVQLLLSLSSLIPNPTVMAAFSSTGPYPPSYAVFSSSFTQPPIPEVAVDLRGHWIQHKWDENVSHIAGGYWYNSFSHAKVRIDETYDGALGSSLFDYTDVTSSGDVLNKQWIIEPSVGSAPHCFNDHVSNPGFPLITADFLKSLNAVFGGVVQDPYVGWVQSWNVLIGGSIPAIAYLDKENVMLGYDFWGQERRTKVITRFFNIVVGKMDDKVFEKFPC